MGPSGRFRIVESLGTGNSLLSGWLGCLISVAFSFDLGVDSSNELLEVAIHLGQVLQTFHGVDRLLALGVLISLSDARV